jgi:large subunit ribosomal protein L29
MAFSKIVQFKDFTQNEIESELLKIEKDLMDLRLKKATRQQYKSHQFKHLKHKKSQLLTLLSNFNR